jgi:hypothetical protein
MGLDFVVPILGGVKLYVFVLIFVFLIMMFGRRLVAWIGSITRLKLPFGEIERRAETAGASRSLSEMGADMAALAVRLDQSMKTINERIDENNKNVSKNSMRLDERIFIVDGALERTEQRVQKLELSLSSILLDQQKTMFYNASLPEEDRMLAGLTYLARGGNHSTAERVKQFTKDNPITYRTIEAVRPDLSLGKILEVVQ